MIILIAESKTMKTSEQPVAADAYTAHRPLYVDVAERIMWGLSGLSLDELAAETKLPLSLAAKMQKYIYDFDCKLTGNLAINAFTGVVFKALDYNSLTGEASTRCNSQVRIVSSLYGWLRPDDIVKTYRLDFTARPETEPVDGRSINRFWRMDVTKALVRELQEQGSTEILNLLPGDASDCIDWKLVKRFAKVWKVDFREPVGDEGYKTPPAGRLKTLRGKLLRQILTEGITTATALQRISSSDYFCEGTPVYPDHLSFLC